MKNVLTAKTRRPDIVAYRHVHSGNLFGDEGVSQTAHPCSAVLLGNPRTDEAYFRSLRDEIPRVLLFPVTLLRQGGEFVLGKAVRHVAQHLMFTS